MICTLLTEIFLRSFPSVKTFLVPSSRDDFPKLQRIAIVWFVGSILCDAIISAAMLYYLLSVRTGYRDTDKLVHTIARGVIETGLATTTIVILDAIFFFRMVSHPLTIMSKAQRIDFGLLFSR